LAATIIVEEIKDHLYGLLIGNIAADIGASFILTQALYVSNNEYVSWALLEWRL
jgi:hypothetical protein